MEFNARYMLVSLFSLAAIFGVFAFVYWLENSGGFSERVEYQVRFSVPVSGMANGSNVLFNGLKVGEVKHLELDNDNPGEFIAIISIDATTPIRTDTLVGVDYQGLTGAANILLTGGEPDASVIVNDGIKLPQLIADPDESRSWTQNAGRVLSRLDAMLAGENNRLDKILAGLERMVGGDSETQPILYDLMIPGPASPKPEKPLWQLVIAEPGVLLSLNTDKIQKLENEYSWTALGTARWADNLPNLVQAKLIQAYENAGYEEVVLKPADVFDAQFKLAIDIRVFHYRGHAEQAGLIDLMAKIVNASGEIISSRRFQGERRISSADEADIAREIGELFSQTASDLISWSVASLNANSSWN